MGYRGPVPARDVLDASPETPLLLAVNRAASSVGGCVGATSSLWRDGVPVRQVSSHPDLGWLLGQERTCESSPLRAAAQLGASVVVEDTLTDPRWPQFCLAALRLGVRATATAVGSWQALPVTFTLYSLGPNGLALRSAELASAMVDDAMAAVGAVVAYDGVRREAGHLSEAIEGRQLIEQAKGMLMHAIGCSAEEAFAELVRTSQRGHLRILDVARHLIEAHSAGQRLTAGPPRRRPRRS